MCYCRCLEFLCEVFVWTFGVKQAGEGVIGVMHFKKMNAVPNAAAFLFQGVSFGISLLSAP